MTPSTRKMLGFAAGEEAGFARFLDRVHPEDRELVEQTIEQLLASEENARIEYRILRPDGGEAWIASRGRAFPGTTGTPSTVMGVSIDVTARKANETALLQEKRLADTLIDSLPGIFYLYDREWRLIRWNRSHETLTGFSPEEMDRRPVLDWFSEPHKDLLSRTIRRVFEEGEAAVEAPLLTNQRLSFVNLDPIERPVPMAHINGSPGIQHRPGEFGLPIGDILDPEVPVSGGVPRGDAVEFVEINLEVLIVDDEIGVGGRLADSGEIPVPVPLPTHPHPVYRMSDCPSLVVARGGGHQADGETVHRQITGSGCCGDVRAGAGDRHTVLRCRLPRSGDPTISQVPGVVV